MIFTAREDIEAPIDQVFRMLSDFEALERSAMRRGAEVQRTDSQATKGAGMTWKAGFRFRGKPREVDLELVAFEPPSGMTCNAVSAGLAARMEIELVALSRRRTRMSTTLELTANTLSARLLVQSLKLARARLDKRFRVRLAEYAKDIEDRFNRRA